MTTFTWEMSDQQLEMELRRVKKSAPGDARLAAEIARDLAESGERYEPIGDALTADVASTGGPTSLSTLLIPLFLAAAGIHVPKLAVPGRPAGGIDSLAQIRGYKTELSRLDIDHALAHAGYAHFEAAGKFAPLDAKLFRIRQVIGAQQVPTLVIASLLAKKMAVGVARAGLDVRVAPSGNFGAERHSALENSRLFIEAARLLAINPFPVLSDARFPYQPYIGRHESLAALADIFSERANNWLLEHLEQCRSIALFVTPAHLRRSVSRTSVSTLRKQFMLNLEAQGANDFDFESLVHDTHLNHVVELAAEQDGFTNYSLEKVRKTFTRIQAERTGESAYPDPIGMILRVRPGAWVEKDQVVATIRVRPGVDHLSVVSELRSAVCRTSTALVSSTTEGHS